MKKKLLFLLSGLLCFGLLFSIVPLKNAFAESTSVSFSISKNDNMTVVSSTDFESDKTFNDINVAMENIYSFLSEKNIATCTLFFDNYQLNSGEQINLHGNFTVNISGTLTGSGNSGNLINVNGTEKISITVLPDTKFENGKYSIYFETSGHTLSFGAGVHSSSKFFTNFITGNQIFVTGDDPLSENVKIAVNYDTDSQMVTKLDNTINKEKVLFLTDGDFYNLETEFVALTMGTMGHIATAKILYDFDKQGGSFFGDSLKYENYSRQFDFDVNFPTSIEKENHEFNGWVGKFTYNEKTYYFDSEMLHKYLNSQNLEDLTENISETNNDYLFTGYYPRKEHNEKNYLHLMFFIENNITPTYSAKWTEITYNIDFVTNSNQPNFTASYNYNENIYLPEPEAKQYYTFDRWYADEKFTKPFAETYTVMPNNNITAYARWIPIDYTITYNLDGGTNYSNNPSTYTVETSINLSAPSKTGYNFQGWFTESTFENKKTKILQGSHENIELYAKWTPKQISVTYYLLGGIANFDTTTTVNYDSYIQKPSDPTKKGSTFAGWWTSSIGGSEFDFNSKVTSTSSISIYARWNELTYELNFISGTEYINSPRYLKYGETIVYPNSIQKKGYSFVGWFKDEALTIESNYITMPENDLTIYAKWNAKQVITMEDIYQSYEYGDRFASFSDFSDIENFEVFYYVNNGWQREVPTKIGSYNVKILRAEDDKYCYFEKTIKNGYTISPVKLNLVWLIAIFYILTIIEIGVIMFVRRMRKMKISRTLSIVVGTGIITTTQEIHLIISAVFFLIGFISMIYEIVSTHRTSNNVNFEASKYDNRNRFKKDLVFQNNTEIDPNYEYETKNNESFGDKYSENDIINMLSHDTFSEDRKKKEEIQSQQDVLADDINIMPKIKLVNNETTIEESFGNKYSNNDILKMMEHDTFGEERQALRDSIEVEEENQITSFETNLMTSDYGDNLQDTDTENSSNEDNETEEN